MENELKILIQIGNDAAQGKICIHCGREFKKAVGHSRKCKKCQRND